MLDVKFICGDTEFNCVDAEFIFCVDAEFIFCVDAEFIFCVDAEFVFGGDANISIYLYYNLLLFELSLFNVILRGLISFFLVGSTIKE
jgi:hypothetical protein